MRSVLFWMMILSCACSSGESGGGGGDPGIGEGGYPFIGTALRTNNDTGDQSLVFISGEFQSGSSAILLNDGIYVFIDDDGPDDNGVWTDGDSTLTYDQTINYEHFQVYTQSYTSENVLYNVIGVRGAVTPVANIPTDITATYNGQSQFVIVNAADEGLDLNGNSQVRVDFGRAQVDVTMDTFTALNQINGSVVTNPIDTMSITNARISGNRFIGGAITMTKNGSSVDLIGPNPQNTVFGNFFGVDNSIPDEVAGLILMEGSEGIVRGIFFAD